MWTQWRSAQPAFRRVLTASYAIRRRPAVLYASPTNARACGLDVRAISTFNESGKDGLLDTAHSPHEDPMAPVRRCLYDFSRAVRGARTATQLTTIWSILSRHEPVVVDGGFLRPVGSVMNPHDEDSSRVEIPAHSLAVRMVPIPQMLTLIQQGQRDTVIENAPSPSVRNAIKDDTDSSDETLAIKVADDRVLLLSDKFIARKIIWALYRLNRPLELTQFVEAFEAERHVWINDNTTQDLVTLGNHVDALYVASLGHLRANTKILDRFEHHAQGDVSRYVASRDAFRTLLTACMTERNGALARRIMDQALDTPTLTTFNVRPFLLSIRACVRGEPKTLEGLQHAMHIYRRMIHEVGYILSPHDWSMLFNACVYLGHHEFAMEVFSAYQTHGIAPFQSRFQQVLRTACRTGQYNTAVEMARTWVKLEQGQEVDEEEARWRRQTEAECFNKILWEMLKGKPTSAQVEEVLHLMQSRGYQAGALVLRRVVTHFFSTHAADDEIAPEAVLYRFFELWEQVPDTIQRTSFVLHLVLEECEERDWSDQCERVIEYALDKSIELPVQSTIKLMDRYAARGQFDDAIHLGELVLQHHLDKAETMPQRKHKRRTDQAPAFIPDAFFESLLRCYLFRERFDDVVRIDDAFQLTARRSSVNAALATILRDARAMVF